MRSLAVTVSYMLVLGWAALAAAQGSAAGGEAAAPPRVVVLVIRSGDAEPELAQALTESLTRQVEASAKVEVMPSEDFQVRLFAPGERAAQDCATNAVCLSGYGKELWLDKIVMGVLYKGEGGYTLNVDLVGVENAEVEQYSNRDLPNLATMTQDELDQEMNAVVFKLFELRDTSLDEGPRKKLVARAGPVQTAMAWGTAGLAGVSLLAGLVLGAQARSIQSELESDQSLTQRDASGKVDDGEGKAMAAYMSFAAAGVLAVTSTALFLIKPLQEVEVEEGGGFAGQEALWIAPGLGPEGPAVTLGGRF